MVLDGSREGEHELELLFFEPGPWASELSEAGFKVDVIRVGRTREIHRWPATVVRLARIFRRRQPDVILNWSPKTHLYGSPAAALAGLRQRVIWWQQGIPRPGLDSPNWIDICARLLPARAVGCYSQAAAEAQRRLRPSRHTFVVPAGSPLPQENTEGEELEFVAVAPVVGLVGRLQAWKGQDRLLKAQAILHERGHSMNLLIVGGDAYGLSPDYAHSLPSLVESLGLTRAVTMTGHVPDASPYIDHMDILVNASDPEPFGIVLLEGMARGVPVVAVNSGGPAEFIEHGVTGILAKSGEPKDLADALEPLLGTPGIRQPLADAAKERYLHEFTDSAMCERFIRGLESAVRA